MIDRRTTPRSRRTVCTAFTLVELLVVIGIIALLISILLPSLTRAREQANAVKCLSNQRQLGMSVQMFVNQHNGFLPAAWANASAAVQWNGSAWVSVRGDDWMMRDPMWGWDYALKTRAKLTNNVFLCPNDDSGSLRGTWNDAEANLPDKSDADNIPASYRWNLSNGIISNPPGGQVWEAPKITRLIASRAIVIAEGVPSSYHHVATFDPILNGQVTPTNRSQIAWDRHRGRSGYVFADGHAEMLEFKETWKVVGTRQGRSVNMWRHVYDGALPDILP